MPKCPDCNAFTENGKKFCGDCGAKMPEVEAVVAGEDGLFYCHKHKKETTRVSCGRCERPICTKCTIIGPAGVRCRDCARNKVPVRMRAVAYEAGKVAGSPGVKRVWYMALFFTFISFFRGMFGGGGNA